MGIYLNPGNDAFQQAINSEIYVDKSMLIAFTNQRKDTLQKYICVSRPRRFGKSMAADMLVSYYSRGCDSRQQFEKLKIAKDKSFEVNLNNHNVIHLNIQKFLNREASIRDMLKQMSVRVGRELRKAFPQVEYSDDSLVTSMEEIFAETKEKFVFVIDEWDCVFRVKQNDVEAQKEYLDFLRDLLKDQPYAELVYMTGILPIKKYGEHSALNMFDEYSMTNQGELAEFTGFTEAEVQRLCEQYDMSFDDMKHWYDGYDLQRMSIYNPKSVVMALQRRIFDNYWTQTETYESVRIYIELNYDGLRDAIVELIAGEHKRIDTTTFTNDMVTFQTKDDVLTLLLHLGYLAYDFDRKEVYIPNHEIREQFISTVRVIGWQDVVKSLQLSEQLLSATLRGEAVQVADIVEQVHQENTSILKYNDENSLSCVLSLAYYSAKKEYVMYRELPAGKGFADLVFVPKAGCEKPAFIVELKWNNTEKTALDQIKDKQYVNGLRDYTGDVLLVGISYQQNTKRHTCRIEKVRK